MLDRVYDTLADEALFRECDDEIASLADNLVPGDTNGTFDVFVRDRQLETTVLASRGIARSVTM